MDIGLIGKKIGMTRIFSGEGAVSAATVIQAGPCVVVQKKTREKEGYDAVQLGFDPKKKRVNSPIAGHFKRAGAEPKKLLREFRTGEVEKYSEGHEITVDVFSPGDYVDVAGISKGKGFAGVMKRWGFGGAASNTHGTHKVNRKPGSIGMSATPARVFKGTKMAGRQGAAGTVIQNLKVVGVDAGKHLLFVGGPVGGFAGSYVIIRKAKKK